MADNQTTNQNPTPDVTAASVPNQYNGYFQDAAKQSGIKPEFLLDIAAMNLKDGQPPAMDDQTRLFIASEHSIKPNPQDISQQWQLYAFYMAEQIADYRDVTKALYTIDFGDKNQAAEASGLLSHALEHSSKIGSIARTSTDSAYVPSAMGLAMIERFEGFRPKAYELGGVKHIGFGHSERAIDNPGLAASGQEITRPQAEAQLKIDLQKYGKEIVDRWPGFLKLPQSIQDACVSYAYNCGVGGFEKSQALKLLKEGHLMEGAEAIASGIHTAGGADNKALEVRRKIEAEFAKMDLQGAATPQLADKPNNTANLGTKLNLNAGGNAEPPGKLVASTAQPTPVHPALIQHAAAALNATPAPAPSPNLGA